MQYLYDLRVPESESGKVVLKPLDGEVESFEASVHGEALSFVQCLYEPLREQLMSLEKVLRHMRAGEFKPNCAIGTFFASPFPFSTAW